MLAPGAFAQRQRIVRVGKRLRGDVLVVLDAFGVNMQGRPFTEPVKYQRARCSLQVSDSGGDLICRSEDREDDVDPATAEGQVRVELRNVAKHGLVVDEHSAASKRLQRTAC